MIDPFKVKMMPGQIPYTKKELKQLYKFVSDVCDEDCGEVGEMLLKKENDDEQ